VVAQKLAIDNVLKGSCSNNNGVEIQNSGLKKDFEYFSCWIV
jgi:hypothetical protein